MRVTAGLGAPLVLASQVKLAGLPGPEFEGRFHPTRKWRVDLLWRAEALAVEVEGGVWTAGRHVRPRGYLGDLEKYNALTLAGFRLIRVTPAQIASGEALALVTRALEGE